MKRSIAFILSLAVLLPVLFTGCKPAASTQSSSSASSSAPVTMTFFWWGPQVRTDGTIKVIQLYQSKHTNVTITPIYQGYTGYYQKLAMMAASNSMPDIFQSYISSSDCSQFLYEKLIEPLDGYITKKVIDTSSITKNILSNGQFDGKLYGIPMGVNAQCIAYNTALYAKAGITVPTNGYASWDAMTADLVKLKAVTGKYGADDILPMKGFGFLYYCRQNGESFIDTKKEIGFSQKTYVDFYNFKLKWLKAGLIPPYDVSNQVVDITASCMAKHQSAVLSLLSNQFENAQKTMSSDKLVMTVPPGPNVGKGLSMNSSMTISMSSLSKNKNEAAKFMSYFINDIDANKILAAERGMPTSSKVSDALVPSFNDVQKQIQSYLTIVNKNCSPTEPPAPSNFTSLQTLINDLDQQISYGKTTPEAAYQQISAKAKSLASSK
jgi:multiple sugar transport system substrate-binding protein